jgi:hypothetical protein
VIRCHRKHLEARCEQRGYTLAEVMPCVVEQDGDRWLVDVDHPAYPRPKTDDWRPIDVGALVERGLTAIGITQERVEKWTRTAGRPGGCGCAARKRWLTEAGNRAQYAVRDAARAAQHFYFGSH